MLPGEAKSVSDISVRNAKASSIRLLAVGPDGFRM